MKYELECASMPKALKMTDDEYKFIYDTVLKVLEDSDKNVTCAHKAYELYNFANNNNIDHFIIYAVLVQHLSGGLLVQGIGEYLRGMMGEPPEHS